MGRVLFSADQGDVLTEIAEAGVVAANDTLTV